MILAFMIRTLKYILVDAPVLFLSSHLMLMPNFCSRIYPLKERLHDERRKWNKTISMKWNLNITSKGQRRQSKNHPSVLVFDIFRGLRYDFAPIRQSALTGYPWHAGKFSEFFLIC